MHEPYDDDNEEDNYDDDQYNDDNNDYQSNPYQWYYQFDIEPNTSISNWLSNIINQWFDPKSIESWNIVNIPGFDNKKFPVNSWNPSTGKGNSFQYLGSNYQGSPVWKKKYFVSDKLHHSYISHLKSHAVHFLHQPSYYNGMFDILN